MANIPGISQTVVPQVFSRTRTLSRAVASAGGLRILSLVGEGRREEVIVDSAIGGGEDGFDPTFTTVSDGYGRFFRTAQTSLVANRTTLLLNGAELRVLEADIDGQSFSSRYDARLEIDTGKIELQSASIVDQGGALYLASSNNTGDGYLSTPTLTDTNAPAEIWTIRCTSVLRDSYGAARRGEAVFIASGSTSGKLLDAYGQPFTWRSDGYAVDNGILSFAIYNPTGTTFEVGDRFTIEVDSKVLQARDTLEARYIAEVDLNSYQTFTDPNKLFEKHGQPSLTNTLSLAAQLAFENGASSVLAMQAKPALPRRTSEILLAARNTITGIGGATGNSDPDDLIFPITEPGKPDVDTSINFFIRNTDGTEDQIFPNKVTFYDSDITTAFSAYEDSGVATSLLSTFMDPAQSGTPFSYTVVTDDKILQAASDGTVTPIGAGSTAYFSDPSGSFVSEDAYGSPAKEIDIITSTANEGRFTIIDVISDTQVRIQRASGFFVSEADLKWQLILPSETSQRILLTTDLALAVGKGLRISYIDEKDIDFFDAGWADALDTLETAELQILGLFPTNTFSAVQQAGRVHVERMSSTFYKKERVLFTGALQGLTVDNVTGVSLAAVEDIGVLEGIQGDSAEEILDGNIEDLANYSVSDNFGDTFRVMFFYPDEVVRVINGTRTLIPGYWIAAAAAGHVSGEPAIEQALTEKILVGLEILNNKTYKPTVLNTLADNGIATAQPVSGGIQIVWGKTTTQSGAPEEEEMSVVFIRDHVARTIRRGLREFVAQPEDPTLIPSVNAKTASLLRTMVSQNILQGYRNLSVARDDVEPRQVNVTVLVQPTSIINWIFADISVSLF